MIENARGLNTGKRFSPATIGQLVPYLRLAYCESVCIDLQWTDAVSPKRRGAAYRALFDDLVLPSTSVNVLTVCVDSRSATEAVRQQRAFEAFKAVSKLVVNVQGFNDPGAFKGAFFVYAAKCGIRSLEFDSGRGRSGIGIDIFAVFSFGFAKAELDGARHVDFKLQLANVSSPIDSTGFEQYQRGDGRTWLVDDLENHINVEVMQTANLAEVHIFSSF
ncbi:hypothetical protein AAVH_30013 [Aphelenchoides avenae]|nr:hypothetical protein AAVH_30013 [Aphelenchus avenae]